MRILLLTVLVMIAFAANTLLTRFAINGGFIDPAGFAVVRVASGAAVLCALLWLRGGRFGGLGRGRLVGTAALAVYIIGHALANLTIDAGIGALILFGVVQITMFGYGAGFGESPTARQISGAAIAFGGLMLVLWPDGQMQLDLAGAALMILAGVGWAAYTINGKGAADPLRNTAGNFLFCVPVVACMMLLQTPQITPMGLALGILCGGVTSGLGYALWYAVLPSLRSSTAAVAQLSVPVIALLGGAALLAEPLGLRVIVATVLVLGGIAWSISARSAQGGHS
jgi:drug/metabolite transporter (DMT)-like permease